MHILDEHDKWIEIDIIREDYQDKEIIDMIIEERPWALRNRQRNITIFSKWADGEKVSDLAKEFGLTGNSIYYIIQKGAKIYNMIARRRRKLV